MADSEALHSRRYRAHHKGDHQYCGPSCAGKPAAEEVTAAIAAVGSVAEQIQLLRADLGYEDRDPRSLMLMLAERLGVELDSNPAQPALVGELRRLVMMSATRPVVERDPAVLDRLRATRAQERVGRLLGMAGPGPRGGPRGV